LDDLSLIGAERYLSFSLPFFSLSPFTFLPAFFFLFIYERLELFFFPPPARPQQDDEGLLSFFELLRQHPFSFLLMMRCPSWYVFDRGFQLSPRGPDLQSGAGACSPFPPFFFSLETLFFRRAEPVLRMSGSISQLLFPADDRDLLLIFYAD